MQRGNQALRRPPQGDGARDDDTPRGGEGDRDAHNRGEAADDRDAVGEAQAANRLLDVCDVLSSADLDCLLWP